MVYLDAVQTGWIIGLSLAFGLVLPLLLGYVMSWLVTKGLYFGWFVRTTPNKYPRDTPSCAEENQIKMFMSGLAYREQEKAALSEVSIVSDDGLKLVGQYLDYQQKVTVIIIPGRSETSSYSFYFAELYKDQPYNLLLIDSRGTGFSEGKFLTAGIKESDDLLAWARYLHEVKKQDIVLFHGICIGAATSLLALAKPSCPDYVKGAFAEGSFKNFKRMFAYHTKAGHHPSVTVSSELPFYFRHYAGVEILKDSPEKKVSLVTKPVCFVHGKEDIYVPYQDGQELYERCGSKEKELHFIAHGEHSKLRYYNPKEYDALVLSFFAKLVDSGIK
jgi:fermentation-respiration switch protein FrsA (DUF1100 family)